MSKSPKHSDDEHTEPADRNDHDDPPPVRFTRSYQPPRRSRWWVGLIVLGVVAFITFGALWSAFFHFVPTGKMLVSIAKNGDPLPAGQVLAEPGQKGVQAAVLGEGWHFVWPIIYATELKDNVMVPAGKVGIVTAQGGVSPRDGRVLAVEDDE